MYKYFLAIVLFISTFVLASPVSAEAEREWQDETIYFIMIDRFNNGDTSNDYEVNVNDPRAYHGGDFKGIIEKLDYIKDMGFTAIWLTPIVKNEPKGYHGYWTEDFYKTEEHFGSLEEFKQLVKEAHERDIKVILDLVVNHTGYQHPWLTDPDKQDWFHEDKPISNWDNQEEVETGRLAGLPDLAQENPEVKEYLLDMAKWWVKETDIDGYRLDTVKHVPKWFWEEFAKEVKSVKEDFFLIGEVWHDDPQYVADYAKTGIDSFVDYPFFNEATRIFSKPDQTVGRLQAVWNRNVNLYENPYVLGNFIDNHDNIRYTRYVLERDQDPVTRLKLALSYMYTAPGIPIIYYGTEVAMDGGEDPDNRRLMEFQDHELVDYISALGKIRQTYPSLTRGSYDLLYDRGGMTIYKRTYQDETVVVAINNTSEKQTATIAASDIGAGKGLQLTGLLSDNSSIKERNGEFSITLNKEIAQIYTIEQSESNYIYFVIIGIAAAVLIVIIWLFRRKAAQN